ncbi:MAG: hypothetical protein Q8P67_25820 [archaeon]|nr:hypothetical protein [archaeon]
MHLIVAQPPALPLQNPDIPSDLSPPLDNGRVSVHGWMWLPWDRPSGALPTDPLLGWFYHHTPEFFTDSPHNFEIMLSAALTLKNSSVTDTLPFPPKTQLVGTEYVFTPPQFSLDQLITSQLTSFQGPFTNGSFDTTQRYTLSQGQLDVYRLATVHYLSAFATAAYDALPYLSFPRDPAGGLRSSSPLHFYFLHLLEVSPDFDQIIHVTLDPASCSFVPGDIPSDLLRVGATFSVVGSSNSVYSRLTAVNSNVTVQLMTENTQSSAVHTKCTIQVLEEIHCVTVPDSFTNCPPVNSQR